LADFLQIGGGWGSLRLLTAIGGGWLWLAGTVLGGWSGIRWYCRLWLILIRPRRGYAGGSGFNAAAQEGAADACLEGFFDDVFPGLVGIGGVALDDALDELVRGLFAQAFLHTAGGDGFEPLAEVFLEGGLSQQGLDALGAACGGEEVGVSLEKVDGIELSLVG
jgi:hypothetical protein